MKHYLMTEAEMLTEVKSSKSGLSSNEAELRTEQYGKNKLEQGKGKSLAKRIWEQVRDPMILVLIGAAVLSGVFSEFADMAIILVVVVLNAILGIVQESKAEKAIEALQNMSAPNSNVRRDGKIIQIKSEDIVPGDIVILEAGDSVPADMRILESASLQIEEAALTGESVPVKKESGVISGEGEIPLGDRSNMAYMGTSVSYGRGEGVAVGTGMNTEMGKIANIISGTVEEKTPLQQKLTALSKILSVAVLSICVVIFFINIFRQGGFANADIFDSLLTAISLAVAAIPEGLVVVVTVLLSIGITRMSKRNSIIRRMTAVETLGCTEIICSDKTGTLTQNKMTVTDHYGEEQMLAKAMYYCNHVEADTEKLVGDPTQVAQKEFGMRYISSYDQEMTGELPFDSNRKMMTTLHKDGGAICQYTTGASDEILKNCTQILDNGTVRDMTEADINAITNANKAMADKALRVLGASYRMHDSMPSEISSETIENNLIFAGLIGMIDPVRPEVKVAMQQCKSAGIRAFMITGDHKDTAVAIAKELGIMTEGSYAVTGAELSQMSDREFEEKIEKICVYARVQPEHKVRIVNTWKKKGKITAMTGDGVNDAPALKSADIGVGMGITGTDVTKNVADMVLADDNFASIVYAVEEGRRIYENIRKAIQFLLASNLSEVVSIFIATLVGVRLFAPIHILWINLVTDTFPAMALGMEDSEPDSMQKPPRDPKETIFSGGLGTDVVYQGVLIAGLTLASFFIGNRNSHITGMTMAFLTLSMCEIFHSFNMRSRDKSIFSLNGHNKMLLGAMVLSFILTLAVIYIPGLNSLFHLTPLTPVMFFEALGLAIVVIPVVEVIKLVMRSVKK